MERQNYLKAKKKENCEIITAKKQLELYPISNHYSFLFHFFLYGAMILPDNYGKSEEVSNNHDNAIYDFFILSFPCWPEINDMMSRA